MPIFLCEVALRVLQSCRIKYPNACIYSARITATVIQQSTVARFLFDSHHKSLQERLEFGLGGQIPLSGWPHNPTTRFWPPSTTIVSPELLPHCAGSLRCMPKEMATGRLWPVCLWSREPETMSHVVDSCPWQSWLADGLSKLHSADDDAVLWLTSYGGP